ncbi:MAG: glucokinase [Pseudomonadota bacterium]|nr:glucokinase [Pseudomonadota bacterium]
MPKKMPQGRTGAPYPRLLGDVGGTEHRYGWMASPGAAIAQVVSVPGSGDLGAEIKGYLSDQELAAPASASLGIAAPVFGDVVTMTNGDARFSIRELERELGVDTLLVINDFAALAHALRSLLDDESWRVGGGDAAAGGALALVGPGTGLGVSGLLAVPGGHAPVVGEGGHATLAAENDREAEVLAVLRRRFGHVSAERVLSGPGIANLHAALCRLSGSPTEELAPAEITQRALDGSDDCCREALDLFFAFLGSVAGDVALTLGARGGVYIGGGIVARLGAAIDRSRFRERFEAKGRYRPYLAGIPTRVLVDSSSLALRGANAALEI